MVYVLTIILLLQLHHQKLEKLSDPQCGARHGCTKASFPNQFDLTFEQSITQATTSNMLTIQTF